jgi:4-methylaminobutanoate oxidase (formaldehyde-forming)
MIRQADVVVIGAGAIGASTAYHLTKLGQKVLVVDKSGAASQTSRVGAAQAMQIWGNEVLSRLAIRGIEKIESFTKETGQPLAVYQTGSIRAAQAPEYVEALLDEVKRGKGMGVEVDVISSAEAKRRAPFFESDQVSALWYAPRDLYIEPGQLPKAYLRAAEQLGTVVEAGAVVTAVITHGDSVEGVVTDKGRVSAPVVVNAAGAWARTIGEMAGVAVPVVPTRHQLYVTRPISGVDYSQPTVRLLDRRVYIRPDRGGLLMGHYEPDPRQVDVRTMPADFQVRDLELDFEPMRLVTQDLAKVFPAFQATEVAEFRGGLPTITADGHFIIDEAPGVHGFFIAAGCNVGGFTTSPAIGEALASRIVTGQSAMDLTPFRLTRFGDIDSEAKLLEACLWAYTHKYSTEEVTHE